jgi:ABC-type nitrate/sulfonate/bicarbonate transport system substrate-binding protein
MSQCAGLSAGRFSGRRSPVHIIAALTLGVTLIVAAGGGAWSESSEPADSTKIIIGQGSSGTAQIPLYVALQQDLFKKAGLDVTSQLLSGGTPSAMASFASGAVNILNLSAPELIQYTAKKVISGKAFGEVVDQQYDIVGSKTITSMQDIKGKTIGVSAPNSGDQIYILALMQHYGISPNDVTFITSGNPVNRLAAIAAGVIQVTAQGNPQREESMKVGTIVLKSADSPVQFPTNMFIASDDLIKNHKPLLKKFLGVLHDTNEWMKANLDAAVAICVKSIGATAEACRGSITSSFDKSVASPYTWSSTSAINPDGIKSALAVMANIDPETKGLTMDDVADTSIAGTTP